MPKYQTQPTAPCIAPGDSYAIVNAEQLGVNNFSERVNLQDPLEPRPVVLNFNYASTPVSVEYDIYVALTDALGSAGYTMVGKTTNVNGDQVTLQRTAAGGNMFKFVMVKEVTSPGVNATCTVYQ